jgi:GMP synthase (glutamine-hydrolysing)
MDEQHIRYLQGLAKKADEIFKEELTKSRAKYSTAETYVLNARTVGVQGDKRVYGYVAELTLKDMMHENNNPYNDEETWEFLGKVMTRIINEVGGLTRVVYALAIKDPLTNQPMLIHALSNSLSSP